MRTWITAALLAIALLGSSAVGQVIPKQIAAPPNEMLRGDFDLPDPAKTGISSAGAMLPIRFAQENGSFVWRGRVPIDDAASVRLLALGPGSDRWRIEVATPNGARRALGRGLLAPGVVSERGSVRIRGAPRDATTHTLQGQPAGEWEIEIGSDAPPIAGDVHGYLMVRSSSPRRIYTHLTTHDLLTGRVVGINTRITGPVGRANGVLIDSAEVRMTLPGGGTDRFAMIPAGADASIDFVPNQPGEYRAHVIVRGTHENGRLFVRTSQLVFDVLPDLVRLQGSAEILPDAPGVRRIVLPLARADRRERAIVSAEIWAIDPAGRERAVCWLSRMALPEDDRGKPAYSLFLDERWLAGISGRLELRNARVQCCDTAVPIARAHRIAVTGAARVDLEPGPVTREMRIGTPRPDLAMPLRGRVDAAITSKTAAQASSTTGGHNLMLVHGYCAGGNPWPVSDFTGGLEIFSDPDQNRSHDQFANLILALGDNSKSYGVIAHSQGGAAALHLWTYYFSGLDWAEGPRLIQSVGTPYQGTPLAGSLAGLGDIFGSGCGENADLAPDGAALWLSGIPAANRDDVYYWTTAPTSGSCNSLSGFFLSDPEDGVVESARGQLPGGNNMGLVYGWCHTTGMSQPAQYFDSSRNTEMNAEAAR